MRRSVIALLVGALTSMGLGAAPGGAATDAPAAIPRSVPKSQPPRRPSVPDGPRLLLGAEPARRSDRVVRSRSRRPRGPHPRPSPRVVPPVRPRAHAAGDDRHQVLRRRHVGHPRASGVRACRRTSRPCAGRPPGSDRDLRRASRDRGVQQRPADRRRAPRPVGDQLHVRSRHPAGDVDLRSSTAEPLEQCRRDGQPGATTAPTASTSCGSRPQ